MLSRREEDIHIWTAALESENGVARQAARERLVHVGPSVAPSLTRLLEDPRAQVRWEAAMTLKELNDPLCVSGLVKALGDEDEGVRWVAAEGLAAIGRPSVEPLLEVLIHGADSFQLRDAAHVVISRLEDPALRATLEPVYEALRERNPPDVVMAAAGDALAGLGANRGAGREEAGLRQDSAST